MPRQALSTRRVKALLLSPWGLALAVIGLMAQVVALVARPGNPATLAERAVRALSRTPAVFTQPRLPDTVAYLREPTPEGSAWVRYDLDASSADALTSAMTERPQEVVYVSLAAWERPAGWWSRSLLRRGLLLRIERGGGLALPPADVGWIRSDYLDLVARDFSPELAYRAASLPLNQERTSWEALPGGVVNDLAVLALGTWLFAAARACPVWLRTRRRARALAQGRCPACGYALTALMRASPVTCPECGSRWDLSSGGGREA